MHCRLLRGCRRKVGLTWMRGLLCVVGFIAVWTVSDSIIKTLGKTYVHVRDVSGVQFSRPIVYTDNQSAIRLVDSFVNDSYLETNTNTSTNANLVSSKVSRSHNVVSSKVSTSRNIESSEVLTSRKLESSKVSTSRKLEASKVLTNHNLESSKVSTSRKLEASKVLTNRNLESSKVLTNRNLESSKVLTNRNLESSKVLTNRNLESSKLSTSHTSISTKESAVVSSEESLQNTSKPATMISREEFLQLRKERVTKDTSQDFPLIISGREICSNVSRLQLVVLVLSVHHEVHARRAIRDTWGSYMYNGVSMRLAFLLGAPPSPDIYDKMRKEARRHGDIVMADFKDSYTNITYKVLMGLRWAAQHCSQAEFIVKTDSDMYNKIPLIVDIIEKYPPAVNGTIYGDGPERPNRVLRTGKWAVDRDMYPLDQYPPYLTGACYFMSARLAMPIYEASMYFPFLSIEDALVTGILAPQVGATLKHLPEFLKWSYYSACAFLKNDTRVVLTDVNPARMYDIWSIQLAYNIACPDS